MTTPATEKKPWFDPKTFAAPLVGLIITCVWGLISMHFAMQQLNSVVTALRETVVELRTTVNEMSRNASESERKLALIEFRVGNIESQLGFLIAPTTSKRQQE